jgi:glutamate/tyrosine decarboxylase-like PLP-dependent enzyme
VVAAAADLLRRYSLHVTHPRYFGLFNPSVHPSGVIADALVALFNPQVGGWTHGPAANELERLVLRRLASSLGLDPDGTAAHFTSGGNEANHTAVLAGLAHRYAEGPRQACARPRLLPIYLSQASITRSSGRARHRARDRRARRSGGRHVSPAAGVLARQVRGPARWSTR